MHLFTSVDPAVIEANLSNGKLSACVPKPAPAKVQKVAVKSAA